MLQFDEEGPAPKVALVCGYYIDAQVKMLFTLIKARLESYSELRSSNVLVQRVLVNTMHFAVGWSLDPGCSTLLSCSCS